MREPSDSVASAAEIFERVGADWALIGALAALRYRATPRLTVDADFLSTDAPGLADEGDVIDVLLAWRPRDRNDIASILETQPVLDESYIASWAERWDVTDRWSEAQQRR